MTEKFKVVISGVSGRFPESNDIGKFKEKLYNGDDFVTTDDRKWPIGWRHKMVLEKMIPDATGKILSNEVDYTVFKMNTTYGLSSDITNKIILEPSFEAIVDAGVNPYSLDGRNIAVFMSASFSDAEANICSPNVPSNVLFMIGVSKTMMSNRLSFALNLTGSSLTQYTDAHGDLEPLVLGYKYVSEGLAEAAVVGVSSIISDPRFSLQYSPLGLLSPDGVTNPFDNSAKGYARSEAAVCFYIQRAEDAKRSYGELLFCDSYYLGSILSDFITYDEQYLRTILRHLYEANNFSTDVSDIAFVEMNAYGNKFMDNVESNVVADLLWRNRENPLMVGSIKSNIGHTESAAGLMAVLKAILTLDSGTVARNLHLQNINNDIRAFKENQLQVVTEETSLQGNTIAVNSIGLHGNVGLAVMKQNEKFVERESINEAFARIVLICGRDSNDLKAKLTQIEKSPYDPYFVALMNEAFGQYMPPHTYRGFTLSPTPFTPVHDLKERGESNRPIWFIFSGMGSQWNGMGKSLLKLPLFAEVVSKCDRVLKGKGIDIYNILTSEDPTLFDDITNAFVGIITVQIGLYEIIKTLGIEPTGIIGHSVGENGCAYADGCLTLEQAVLASWARGVASTDVKLIKGMMAAVGLGYADIKDILPDDIQVACHNSADSCTLTGPAASMNLFVRKLQNENIFARAVNVANIAYHSKYIEPAGPKLLERLKQVIKAPNRRSSKWISTSVPEGEWDTSLARYCSAEYLTNNLLSPVLFEEACKHIPKNAICIEFAPHGLLQAILNRSLPETCTNIPLTNRIRTQENLNFLLAAIGKLYIAGLEPRVNDIFPKLEYPVPRGTPSTAPYCTWYHQDETISYHITTHLEELTMSSESIPICIREDSEYAFLKDHKIDDNMVIPPSFFMYLAWKMLSYKRMEEFGSSSAIFENIKIHKHVRMRSQNIRYAFVRMVQSGSGNFEVILLEEEESNDFQIILTGHLVLLRRAEAVRFPKSVDRNKNSLTSSQFYDVYENAGYRLGKEFALVQEMNRRNTEYEAKVTWNGNWVTFIDALMKIQMFADNNGNVHNTLPSRVRNLKILAPECSSMKNGTLLTCKVDTKTKELLCSCVAMNNLGYKSRVKTDNKKFCEFRFVSYRNPQCESVSEFLKFCLLITAEINSVKRENGVNRVMVSDVTSKNEYAHIIKESIVRDELILQKSAVLHPLRKSLRENESALIITDAVEEVVKLSTSSPNAMILIISPSAIQENETIRRYFVEVTTQSFSGRTFTLLKKMCRSKANKRQLVPKKRTIRSKIQGLEKHIDIRKNIGFEDVSLLVGIKQNYSSDRYLYIMDEVANKQKLDESIEKQLDVNLQTTVFKKGEWGSYRNLVGSIHQKYDDKHLKNAHWLLNFRDARIDYICMDNETATKNDDISLKGVSFSYAVTTKETKKIMGIGSSTSNASKPEYDENLSWAVPSTWSSKDAAMVSYVYCQAYYILFPTHLPDHAECVLINVGNQYYLAEALISLALYRKRKVFLTVKSDEEKTLFTNRFPELKSHRILRRRDYETQILQKTNGAGADLVINCLQDIQHVNASLRCLKKFGVYFEIGSNNCVESLDIGLYDFLKCISFCPMKNGLSNLLKLNTEAKKKVKMAIEEGIDRGVISPLQIKQYTTSMKILNRQSLEKLQSSRKVKYDGKHSYMIVGGDRKDTFWPDIIEWLVSRGARKFVVFLEKYAVGARNSHQLNQLVAQNDVRVLLVSASKLYNKQEASTITMETEKLGPLGGIFFVATKCIGRKITTLDGVVSPDVPFIGLSCGGLAEFEERRSRGSAAILVHCDKPRDALIVLPHLNELLGRDENNNAGVLYHVEDPHSRRKKKCNSRLQDYLPQNIETLSSIGQDNSEDLIFVETTSLSKRYSQCKGVYPVFVLPAIHKTTLNALCQRIFYPVFTANMPCIRSVEETAHQLYESLRGIQPAGPVTLISETWNLPLALEMVSHLQSENRKYKIFILEGKPQNWMHQISSDESDAYLADIIFHFVNKSESISTDMNSFEDRIEKYARTASSDTKMIASVIKAANMIRDKVLVAKQQFCKTNQRILLKNAVLFERHSPPDQAFNLSVSSRMVILDVSNYESLLADPELSKIINEDAVYR